MNIHDLVMNQHEKLNVLYDVNIVKSLKLKVHLSI